MKNVGRTLSLAGLICALGACDEQSFEEPAASEDADFRFFGFYPGNGPIGVYSEPSATDFNCFVFDIGGDAVFDPDGIKLLTLEDGGFRASDGSWCAVEESFTAGRFLTSPIGQIIDPNTGKTLLYAQDNKVYDADGKVLYTFLGRHIFDGWPPRGKPLLSADEHIRFANTERKLLLGALISGSCGTSGLPPEDEHEH